MRKFILLIVSCFLFTQSGFALNEQPITVQLKILSKAELKNGRGVILSSSDLYETNDIAITKLEDKLFQVSFSVPPSALKDDAVATALVNDSEGNIVFADVTPSLALDPHAALSLLDIKPCAPDTGSSVISTASIGPLRQLVDIRSARSELAKLKLEKSLDTNLLVKLKKFEEAFGYKSDEELSPQIDPGKLVERLSRLSFSIGEYKVSRFRKSR